MGKSRNNSQKILRPQTYREYKNIHNSLTRKGYVALEALKNGVVHSLSLGERDESKGQAQDMASHIGGSGVLSTGPLANVAWSFDSADTTPTSISGQDGKQLGRGYIKYGPGDNLPSMIYAFAKALPYTASPLRYLADLATGLGPRLMYRFPDGTATDYRFAGHRLLQELEQLEKDNSYEQLRYGDGSVLDEALGIKENKALKRAREAYEAWDHSWNGYDEKDADGQERHIPGAKEFLDDNDLTLHCSQCMQDDMMFDNYFPTVGFERGRRGKWDPRIVRVSLLPVISGVRYEAMNEYRYIEHVYYGDMWRTKGGSNTTITGADRKAVMYPAIMPQGRKSELDYLVARNQRTRIKDRPTWAVCPIFYGNKNYYQQPAWWSIFLAKFFDFASTIAYDKAKSRENRTSWGKIFYISLDYLDQVFSDEGYQGNPEAQQEFIDNLEQSMEDFLQHRENHGKMMRQWMWQGQDGKDHHNVEIVDVAETTKDAAAAGKEELELATSPIFLALGVDPRLVGVPMVAASNGGTALREMHLLKQQQLNVRQQSYIRFLNSVASFNRWANAEFVIKQQTLTTLDRNPTGTIETVAGEGA